MTIRGPNEEKEHVRRPHCIVDLERGPGHGFRDDQLRSSGAFARLPVSWAARTEKHDGKTSPEELMAAAHSACFSMAFSARLGKNGTPPTKLDVSCAVTFDKLEAGWKVTESALTVTGVVPGIDEKTFLAAGRRRKENCPISVALKGNVDLERQGDPRR